LKSDDPSPILTRFRSAKQRCELDCSDASVTRSDHSSQTSAEKSAATWRTQRSLMVSNPGWPRIHRGTGIVTKESTFQNKVNDLEVYASHRRKTYITSKNTNKTEMKITTLYR